MQFPWSPPNKEVNFICGRPQEVPYGTVSVLSAPEGETIQNSKRTRAPRRDNCLTTEETGRQNPNQKKNKEMEFAHLNVIILINIGKQFSMGL